MEISGTAAIVTGGASGLGGATARALAARGAQVFAFKPHVSGEGVGSVDMKRKFPYRTNAHGLRDRDRPAKASGTTRVLVVGDSYTWGYAIAEEESFPQVAERMLAERGRADIEVINGGVPDYNAIVRIERMARP